MPSRISTGVPAPTRSRTVLVAHPSPDLYGSDRMLLESVAGLVASGWRTVVALPANGPLVALLVGAGAEVAICPTPILRKSALRPRGLLALVRTTAGSVRPGLRLLRELRPAVVLVNTVTVPAWNLLARAAGRPVVVHVHEAEESIPRALRTLLALPQAAAATIIVNSRATARVLSGALPLLGPRLRLVYNGVAGPPDPSPPRPVLTGAVRLVFVGRLSPRKGPDLAVEAVRRLRAAGREVSLDLVGAVFEGYEWFERELRDTVAESGLGESVRFRGFSDPVWPAYEEADIALCTSRDSEPFGNVSVEAQLARRPVVVTAVQGLVETVDGGRRGTVVPADDAEALAVAIGALIDDWPFAVARAERAREECVRLFAPARYRSDIAATLAEVAARPRNHQLRQRFSRRRDR